MLLGVVVMLLGLDGLLEGVDEPLVVGVEGVYPGTISTCAEVLSPIQTSSPKELTIFFSQTLATTGSTL